MLQAYLTEESVRQNDDMRRISAWVAIWTIPTLLAGIYGMNFRHMPELDWRFAYPVVLLVMAASAWPCTVASSAAAGCSQAGYADDGTEG